MDSESIVLKSNARLTVFHVEPPSTRARTLLAYGHVLRRQKRRRAARAALGDALAQFEWLGAQHFVGATQGTNKEVAAEIFVTVSTVEATLTRVYAKLGLSSRSQLARALAERPSGAKR
jgi:ATP/maltotriose-dependent transcriptional regulator MalT